MLPLKHPITVDPKGPWGEAHVQKVVKRLHTLGASAKVGRLHVGDFAWMVEGTSGMFSVTVEQKTVQDFIASINPDDRLTRFVRETGGGVPDASILRVVLIEGDPFWTPNFGREWDAEAIDNARLDLQRLGVRVVFAKRGRALERLVALWNWTGRDDHRTFLAPVVPRVTGYYADSAAWEAVRFLMTLPGIGEKRAVDLLKVFGRPEEVIRAVLALDYKAFQSVRGVGKGLVDVAYAFLLREVVVE